MTTEEKLAEILAWAKSVLIISRPEDFNVHDWSGGNIDDAYDLGYDQADSDTAEYILGILNDT